MSATTATVEAQAKVNLWLRVLAREEGGYHQLETLFARIELADTVRIATDTATRELTCRGADLGPKEENLAFRAAAAFAAEVGWPRGFAIEIEKRIPLRGGLGGGERRRGWRTPRPECARADAPRGRAARHARLSPRRGCPVPHQ